MILALIWFELNTFIFAYLRKFWIFQSTCVEVIVNLQQENYPEYDDIQENFLISEDGTVYEARGYSREGQTTYESSLTSFNTQAVSVSFLINEADANPNPEQLKALCYFLKESIKNENLSKNFKAYHRSDLVSSIPSYNDNQDLNELSENCEVKWKWEERKSKLNLKQQKLIYC